MAILLTTGRLNISALRASDIPAFVSYRQDPEVARWQSWDVSYGRERAVRLVAGQEAGTLPAPGDWLQLGVRDAARTDLLGDVAVHTLAGPPNSYELGVTFARSAQGQGLA
ncbi:MAG: GNAT family N-acetyltransferase, partial [Actinomycetota bacterium]|nr:GNAT family N-acetyltransferase [Actinomycetota bacterium]